jgi:hypothetical protein
MLGLPQLSADPVLFLPLWLGTLRDIISGDDPTISGAPIWRQIGAQDAVFPTSGASRLTYPETPAMLFSDATFFLSTDGIENGAQILLDRGGIANMRLQLGNGTLTLWGGSVASTEIAPYDGAKTLAVTLADSNPAVFYTDGSLLGPGTNPISLGAGAGDLITLSPAGSRMRAGLRFLAIYPSVLTPTEIADLHTWSQSRITPRKQWPGAGLQYPGRPPAQTGDPLFLDNIQSARVSLANESSGQLSNTGYQIESGTWKVAEDATTGERYIECVTAGILSRRNVEAYGTWVIDIQTGATAQAIDILSDTRPTPQTGYRFSSNGNQDVSLIRVTGGAGASTIMSTPNGAWPQGVKTRFTITRSSAGVFSVYLGNELLSVDSGSNPGTDNTHKSSLYCLYDIDAGDRLYADRQFAGVVSPI